MVNGVSGMAGLLVLKHAAVGRQQERENAITLLLPMVALTVLVTPKRPKIARPKLVQRQVIQYDSKVRFTIEKLINSHFK